MEYIKKADAISWGILGFVILITYLFFSDGEFSLIFTLAGTVQAFGFALILIKIRKSRSVSGLSRETFICYFVIFIIRTIIYVFYKVKQYFNVGLSSIWFIRWYNIQTPINSSSWIHRIYHLCYHGAIQNQL